MSARSQQESSTGFATIWIVVVLALAVFLAAGIWWFTANNHIAQSQLDTLRSQITQIESKYESAGSLSDQDEATLANIGVTIATLQDKVDSLP
jgi:uncharacterized protein HemX